MPRITFKTIKAGDIVTVGHGKHKVRCKFLGFTDNHTAYSVNAVFDNASVLFDLLGVRTFPQLQAIQNALAVTKGYAYRAVFLDLEAQTRFAAYLSDGRWCVGTHAERCGLSAAS